MAREAASVDGFDDFRLPYTAAGHQAHSHPSFDVLQGARQAAARHAPAAVPPNRVVHEHDRAGDASTPWDAAALQYLFHSTLRDQQVIVVSNRAPVSHERVAGALHAVRPSSGLVTAVEPVLQACHGTWIAHGSGSADREVVDADDVWRVCGEDGRYTLRRIWLDAEERAGYCDGLANGGLWPLCHMAHVKPRFIESDWFHYRAVNQRFAQAVVQQAQCSDPIVLVQDYHLALVPALVRRRLPRATLISFWHVPWAHADQMQTCPWLAELVHGLLGSDIVGFQTTQHRRNFVASAALFGHELDLPSPAALRAQARSYPISIAWPTAAETQAMPDVAMCRSAALRRWGLPEDGKLLVGVDRFDYTKGLVERLLAVERLLLDQPRWRGRLRFVQVAAPTREALPEYAALRAEVTAQVQRINQRFDGDVVAPIVLLDAHHDKDAVNALYRAADVCLVTPLHDGMNLVAKEFVAVRDDERGVLVLSRFAGAAHELHEALQINPYDTAQVAQALQRALDMPLGEQQQRMRALRHTVRYGNVHGWAARMLIDAVTLRAARAGKAGSRAPLALAGIG